MASLMQLHAIRMLHIIITMHNYYMVTKINKCMQAPIKSVFVKILTMMITISAKITILIRKRITIATMLAIL